MRILSVFLLCLSINFLSAQDGQNFWQSYDEDLISLTPGDRQIIPNNYQTVSLDKEALKEFLRDAPKEFTTEARETPLLLDLPMPDGSLTTFAVSYSPVMMEGLASRYPGIKSYRGHSVSEKGMKLRFSVSNQGFHGVINTLNNGPIYIDPYAKGDVDHYITYFTKDHVSDIPAEHLTCGVGDLPISEDDLEIESGDESGGSASTRTTTDFVELRTFRLALGCTGEWGNDWPDLESALAQMVIGVNRLNQIFEIDASMRVMLIDDNDQLIWQSSQNDPWTNTGEGGAIIGAATGIFNSVVGAGSYDYGHVFNGPCNVGGVAFLGGVCTAALKAGGTTCQYSSSWEYTIVRITAHEMGHSFNASHTWNKCGSIDNNNISPGTAYEPGSGNTIMSYNGVCGNDPNVTGGPHDYYHASSLEQIHSFTQQGIGSACAEVITTSNHYPELELPYPNGFYIPISTPFQLTADASDEDGDEMTYCWEQYNLSPQTTDMGSPIENEPSFRSFFPTTNPTRVFPKMQNIVSNQDLPEEVLPTYARNLKFRCSVRDNNEEIGAVLWDEISFEVSDQAGPFLVTYPNQSTTWEAGQYIEVTWDVANTDAGPVNCQTVNIKLSLDGGYNYPITLVENVPNDGSHFIMVPDEITTIARVRVEAADNIFFDISNQNFEIVPATTAGYSYDASPYYQQVCLPEPAVVELPILSLMGYDSLVTFELTGLPTGAVADFSNNPVAADEGTQTITIDMNGVSGTDQYEVTVIATAPEADTLVRTFNLDIVSNDFSALALTGPFNGEQDVAELPTLTWDITPNASHYEIQIADNPSFDAASIVDEDLFAFNGEYTPSVVLEKSTPYFWRVRPVNVCGPGPYTSVSAFHTEVLVCSQMGSDNVPINISASGTPIIFSLLDWPNGGEISDVNVTKLQGTHDLVKHIRVILHSPDGTVYMLFTNICAGSNTSSFDLVFDDSAPNDIPCPPLGGAPSLPQGAGGLAVFNGEEAEGLWMLEVRVLSEEGEGGTLIDWELEICSNATPAAPVLINNNTLAVPPGMTNTIVNDLLLCEDSNNTPEELEYTVVEVPQNGVLIYNGAPLEVGDVFRQSTINAYNLTYEHDGSATLSDSFVFTVGDGEGGWIPMTTFNIEIDENATVSTEDILLDNSLLVYPNPAQDILFVKLEQAFTGNVNAKIYNVQGQVVDAQTQVNGNETLSFDTSRLPAGLYIVEMEVNGQMLTGKVAVF